MEIKRKKFQGVLNILSFNRHFYIIGLAILALVIISKVMFQWPESLFLIIVILFLYNLVMPLIISAYVYDFSDYYKLNWLKDFSIAKLDTKQIININAGFDETSFTIKDYFYNADLKVFDFYNVKQHTEPAIVRARKVSLGYPNTKQIDTSHIPLNDKSTDLIFLLSAVHEIRSHKEKILFLSECHRVCKPDGRLIIVEHLRDFPNFLAFSIGFTHFFSQKIWKNTLKSAGFTKITETKFTPFMSIFNCQP